MRLLCHSSGINRWLSALATRNFLIVPKYPSSYSPVHSQSWATSYTTDWVAYPSPCQRFVSAKEIDKELLLSLDGITTNLFSRWLIGAPKIRYSSSNGKEGRELSYSEEWIGNWSNESSILNTHVNIVNMSRAWTNRDNWTMRTVFDWDFNRDRDLKRSFIIHEQHSIRCKIYFFVPLRSFSQWFSVSDPYSNSQGNFRSCSNDFTEFLISESSTQTLNFNHLSNKRTPWTLTCAIPVRGMGTRTLIWPPRLPVTLQLFIIVFVYCINSFRTLFLHS